jgi:serine/threonine-protein kinase
MNNPYAPPKANVVKADDAELEVPEEILKRIRQAAIAGAISCGITLLFTLVAIAGTSLLGFTAWELLDVALIAGLSYGIYRKSRVCAVLMLVYFVGAKIYMMSQGGQMSGLVLTLVFLYYYALGVHGTFQYHAWVKQHR